MNKEQLLERLRQLEWDAGINYGAWHVLLFKSRVKEQVEVRYQNDSAKVSYGLRKLFSGYFITQGPTSIEGFAFLLDEGLIRFAEKKRDVDVYVVRHDWRKQLERYFANVDADNARQDAVIAALEASEASENGEQI